MHCWHRAPQPRLETTSETAEVRVLTITEGEQGIVEVVQCPRLAEHLALEGASAVGRFAVAECTHHEERAMGLAQVVFTQLGKGAHLNGLASCLQLLGTLPGQLFGKATLAGEADQPAVASAAVGDVATAART